MATLEIRNEPGRKVWIWHCESVEDQNKAVEQAEDQVGDGWIIIGEDMGELVVILYDYDYYPQ